MKRFTTRIAAFFALLMAFAAPQSVFAEVTAMVSYADWCGPCQILQPKLHSAASEFDDGDVEIVYIDFTDMSAENFLAQIDRASPLTADDFLVNGEFLKTGFAYVLVDGDVVGEVSAGMSTDDIVDIFQNALKRQNASSG